MGKKDTLPHRNELGKLQSTLLCEFIETEIERY